MIDTRPISLTDAQWDLVLATAHLAPNFTVQEFDDVHAVLIRAHSALRHNLPENDERRLDAITGISLWPVANSRNDDFLLSVTLAPGCTLQSDLIDMSELKDATAAPATGWSAIRTVLTRLIAERNKLCEAFALSALEFDGLTGYAEHRGVDPTDLFDTVHDTASAHAADMNNEGLGAQIPYLIEQNGRRATRNLIDEIAAAATD
ncbi:hypothetical protein [Nonomuraea bangladeshensis]|uniref:hypothetical protein n=1 Tax=Nonomuraea bangladeshensis TaxID=404385 RepID=UPI003C2D86F5